MANSLCCNHVLSITGTNKPGILITRGPVLRRVNFSDEGIQSSGASRFQAIVVKAIPEPVNIKSGSILCRACEGNGNVACSQCKGAGVNSVDHFNGQFKAGGLCWLCRGKKEILCGDCNGAGFMGGFMSTGDS